MKRTGYLIERIAEPDNLYLAYCKACRGKRMKPDAKRYGKDLGANLRMLRWQILSGEVSVGNYSYFTITDPKQRLICAADFSERVLHHALMNVCHDVFDRTLIADTYATRRGKGVYAALDKASAAMKRYGYAAKLDVRKYFDSVHHSVLKEQLRRLFKDACLLSIFDRIIDSYPSSDDAGLPIGNLTSQYFANCYLSGIDHWMKEQRRVPVFIRYMDDMLLFRDDKRELKEDIVALTALAEGIGLMLKPPVILPTSQGISFLGYKLYANKRLLERRGKIRFARKMKEYATNLADGIWSEEQYREHTVPLLAFVQKAYTKQFRETVNRRMAAERLESRPARR